ncbi:ryanodine receptor 3 isoform X8 [Tachysurus ichikawai]
MHLFANKLNPPFRFLAALIRGNRNNCTQFSQNLDWLVSKLERLESSSGILEVLHCILIESPEALNIIQRGHIKSIISLLYKHGRNHKILDVLCSLCVCNGVAVRANQNLICDHLLPKRDLLLQTRLVNDVQSMRPNIFLGVREGSAQYKKWYFELMIDQVEHFVTSEPSHLRVGWASSKGYAPYPGGGEGWGGNGVGDDLYSYGFDGLHLWSGRIPRRVASVNQHILTSDDVVSCCLDLGAPSISFRINGQPVQGMFESFNTDGLFFPVVSFSAGVKVRFLLGGRHGEFKFLPPSGYAPCYEALLPKERMRVEPVKEYKRDADGVRDLLGTTQFLSQASFIPTPVDTTQIVMPPHLEKVRDRLAENIHELWAINKIELGWTYGKIRDDNKRQHPCLVDFSKLPETERNYNLQMSTETLKTLLALGCHVVQFNVNAEEELKKVKLPKNYMMSNGYKPMPLELSEVKLSPAQELLVDKLAENAHNVWAKDRVKQGWTYGIQQDLKSKRNPRLVPYALLDERTKKSNRDSLREAIRTLIGYGYNIEPPDQEGGCVVERLSIDKIRFFRLERTYAVKTGKWYFEFEIVTGGDMRVGWARPGGQPDVELGTDDQAFVFDGYKGHRLHQGSRLFGRCWHAGDVVGCMINMEDKSMIFTLNGEILITNKGSELCFADFETEDGFIPVCSLGLSQVGRMNLGKDASTFKYYTMCGLQEGFQPFAVNMNREVTMWFSKRLPTFVNVPKDHSHIAVIRIDGTIDSPPCLKVTHKTFGTQNSNADMVFCRLSMPVEFHSTYKNFPVTEMNGVHEEEPLKLKYRYPVKSMKHVDEGRRTDYSNITTYSHSVRVFAGQDPSCVWVGWVTPDFHYYSNYFNLSKIRTVTVTLGDERGRVHESVKRSNCYIVWGGDAICSSHSSSRSNVDLEIGCLIDLATGLVAFTVNGRELPTSYQVEPNTKLFPAVFVRPTSSNLFQFELTKIKNAMPLSSAIFKSEHKNPVPQCPPRLDIQTIKSVLWSRMPNTFLKVDTARVSERHGWQVQCLEPLQMLAVHIPEENRCVDIMELSEQEDLRTFHYHTLKLYCALCALGNTRVAHALCSHLDQSQLLYIIDNQYLSGMLRQGFYDVLISIHLETAKAAQLMMNNEFIIPITAETRSIRLFLDSSKRHQPPGVGLSTSLKPRLSFAPPCFITPKRDQYLYSPAIPLDVLREKAISMLTEAVQGGGDHIRDPVGGSVEYQFVPILRLISTMLTMGVLTSQDVHKILLLIELHVFGEQKADEMGEATEKEGMTGAEEKAVEAGEEEANDKKQPMKGLLEKKLPESVKLQMCKLLQYFCDCELRHRIEAIVSFSDSFASKLQFNQKFRYNELMLALNMSAAVTAKKTKEFRSPPQEQINMLLNFSMGEDCPCPEDIREELYEFHSELCLHCGIPMEEEEEDQDTSFKGRLMALVNKIKGQPHKAEEKPKEKEQAIPSNLKELISQTMVSWAQESDIQDPELVRAMFSLLRRQYDSIGELLRAMRKSYTISAASVHDTIHLLASLGQIRSLLSVRMGKEEEQLMIDGLSDIMNNKVFYQHPNLMRVLGMHETVMEVMVNVLGGGKSQEIAFPKMVASCCRFLCYFCRISRQNQKAMFDHLSYLLENSSVGLASPSMRGSTPLDVAASSVMDNNSLALALEEPDLNKVVTYLAGCGLQSCPMLLAKGYPDIGWNPIEGERYLSFLRFAVFVNGESVEENSSVVVKLLIRRPECFGPALRGEGGNGLLAAMKEAIKISETPALDLPSTTQGRISDTSTEDEEEEEVVHMGNAIMSFYSALIDLLGRCAPEMHLINKGKGEALRIRAILRSLVPTEDLVGIISIPLRMPVVNKDGSVTEPDMSACFCPDHKAPMVLFLDRVYGIEDQSFLLHLLEVGFLPDLREAASLDTEALRTTETALAMNRYIGSAMLPLLTRCAPHFAGTEHHVTLIDSTLHTIYQLSKGSSLTKAQRDAIEECLLAVCKYLRPSMLQQLLRRLVFDVPLLSEYCKMPLKAGGQDQERKHKKRRGEGYSIQTSLIVAALKKMLPIGLNMCTPGDQELISLAKTRYGLKDTDEEVKEHLRRNMHLQERSEDPAVRWQLHLYKDVIVKNEGPPDPERTIDRIQTISAAVFHLEQVEQPLRSKKCVWQKLLSKQRKRAVVACFRMAPLYNLPRHRSINLFLTGYQRIWIETETYSFEEKLVQDLARTQRKVEEEEEEIDEIQPDPLHQLILHFSHNALTERSSLEDDLLYIAYTDMMAKSCAEDENEDEEGKEKTFEEKEMEKQKMLYQQARLHDRGAAEMVLQMISASRGRLGPMVTSTLKLGISILNGGNILVQQKMLDYLKEKRDAGFFKSLSGLMQSCSVLDLNAFERQNKAEGLGMVTEEGSINVRERGSKVLQNDEFTKDLFRFLQLLCEGHNNDFQNFLRTQTGNTTTVNIIISTVDYLLRLQESISDFYWYYSGKDVMDEAGQRNFSKALNVAKQIFNSLTEYIQGPCIGNQQSLAHSRLWDAVVGFLHVFANMQMKLSQDSSQIKLLKELMDLQKDMIVMMLSLLEGNVVNGTIGKQMVDTLVESSNNVEMILKFFDMFLKLKDLTTSDSFKEHDSDGKGVISKREFQKSMENQKQYSQSEIEFLLSCVEADENDMFNYVEFVKRFHEPAKDIGFNVAVLLTNLSEHMPHDSRLATFLNLAESVLNYFEAFLGRIEIMGGAKRIERVYFEISESSRTQWEKPQVKESKRQFIFDVVNEGGESEKMELFVNFCEDTIFEMQLASLISEPDTVERGEEDEDEMHNVIKDLEVEEEENTLESSSAFTMACVSMKKNLCSLGRLLTLKSLRKHYKRFRKMSLREMISGFFSFFWMIFTGLLRFFYNLVWCFFHILWSTLFGGGLVEGAKNIKVTDILGNMPDPTQFGIHGDVLETEKLEVSEASLVADVDQMAQGDKTEMDLMSELLSIQPKKEGGKHGAEPGLGDVSEVVGVDSPSLVTAVQQKKAQEAASKQSVENELNAESEKADTEDGEKNDQVKSKELLIEPSSEEERKPSKRRGGRKKEQPEVIMASFFAGLEIYQTKILNYLARNFYNLRFLALFVAFAINFILLFYKVTGEESEEVDSWTGRNEDEDESAIEYFILQENTGYMAPTLRFLAVLHTIISFLCVVGYYYLKVPLVVFKREKEIARKLEFDGLYITEQPSDDDIKGQWDRLVINTPSFPNNYWDKFVKRKVINKYGDLYGAERIAELLGLDKSALDFNPTEETIAKEASLVFWLSFIDTKYHIWKMGVVFTDNSFLYLVWYTTMSILGHYNNFFFAAHLLDIAMGFKTLRTILSSVTHNGKQLVLTVGLLAVVVYLYTVVAFNFFRKFYNKSENEDEPDMKCDDMMTCYLFHMYVGVRAGGGIGDEIEDPAGDPYELYRILFDITFFFFVIVILLAIIQGLIIDAFGELRDQQEQVKEDMETKCFICGIGNEYFDTTPHGFETHTLQEHNLANYLFFLMYLVNKDETEHTGQESYVWKMYQERCWDFFPAGDCFRKQYEDQLG